MQANPRYLKSDTSLAQCAMNDKTYHLLKRFPDNSHTLVFLMAEDPRFLALCEDYDACIEALQYWTESKKPVAEIQVNEYRTLFRELEEEIIQFSQIQFLRMVKLMPAPDDDGLEIDP